MSSLVGLALGQATRSNTSRSQPTLDRTIDLEPSYHLLDVHRLIFRSCIRDLLPASHWVYRRRCPCSDASSPNRVDCARLPELHLHGSQRQCFIRWCAFDPLRRRWCSEPFRTLKPSGHKLNQAVKRGAVGIKTLDLAAFPHGALLARFGLHGPYPLRYTGPVDFSHRFPLFDLLGLSLSLSSLRCTTRSPCCSSDQFAWRDFVLPSERLIVFTRLMFRTCRPERWCGIPKRSPYGSSVSMLIIRCVGGPRYPARQANVSVSVADSDRMAASMREEDPAVCSPLRSPYAGGASRQDRCHECVQRPSKFDMRSVDAMNDIVAITRGSITRANDGVRTGPQALSLAISMNAAVATAVPGASYGCRPHWGSAALLPRLRFIHVSCSLRADSGYCLVAHVEYLTVGQAAISPRFPYRIRLLDDSAERSRRATLPLYAATLSRDWTLIPMLGQPLSE